MDFRSSIGRGFESRQEHKKTIFFPSQKRGCADSLCSTPVCVYSRIRKTMHGRKQILKSISEFGGLWKHENNQHALVPPKKECGCQSGGGIKNGHIRYRRNAYQKKKNNSTEAAAHCQRPRPATDCGRTVRRRPQSKNEQGGGKVLTWVKKSV